MNEKLLNRLGLKPDATPEQIEAVVSNLIDQNNDLKNKIDQLSDANQLLQQLNNEKPETDQQKLEKRISRKITESGGALSRAQALIAIQHQDEAAKSAKFAKKK